MKKLFLFLSLVSALSFSSAAPKAAAAACADMGAGSVSLAVPLLPSRGIYTIWSRVQVPDDTHTRYRLEVNGSTCFTVGGSSITPGEWTWVSFENGILTNTVKYEFKNSNGNTVKLLGEDAGVRVDRLLLVKSACVPEGLGANCESDAVPVAALDTSGATEVPPPSSGEVRGIIIPSQTVSRNPKSIKQVVYYVDGSPLPVAENFGLDTTLLENGTHRVSMQITAANGSVSNEVTTITVKNPENVLSGVKRWIRLHEKTTVILSSVVGGALLILAIYFVIRHIRLQKRLLRFHGF